MTPQPGREALNQEPRADEPAANVPRPPVDDPRVYLAAERTYLAWVRTALGLMGFGFLIARFGLLIRSLEAVDPTLEHRAHLSPYLGFGIVCVGVVVCLIAAARHRVYVLALQAGVSNPPRGLPATMLLAAVLTISGLVMAILILLY